MVKRAAEMEAPEQCPKCQTLGERRFLPARLHFTKTSVRHAEFNPAFGKVIRNDAHLRDELAQHEGRTGSKMIEVGNDFGGGSKMVSTHRKRKEEEREAAWKDVKVEL